MSIKHTLSFFFLLAVGWSSLSAQTIVDELKEKDTPSEGRITIASDPAITQLLGRPVSVAVVESGETEYIKMNGFRILVFMGNDPKKSKSEAESKQATIKEGFEITTYLEYASPSWKLQAGDFLTREEAMVFKQQLEKKFPQFGKEMYIVSSEIKVPIHKTE